jgi:hypothetical protein
MAVVNELHAHEGHEGKRKTRYEVNDIRSSKYFRYWQYNFSKHTKCRQFLNTIIFLSLPNHKCHMYSIGNKPTP